MRNGLIVNKHGTKLWYLNDKLHRIDGPAIEGRYGGKYWYLNNKLHRVDGHAFEGKNGTKWWFLNGKQLTEKQIKTFKEILSCPIEDLPLFMGDELFASVIENRFKKEEIKLKTIQ